MNMIYLSEIECIIISYSEGMRAVDGEVSMMFVSVSAVVKCHTELRTDSDRLSPMTMYEEREGEFKADGEQREMSMM